MNQTTDKEKKKAVRRERRKKKKNALIVCRDGKEFWTTQQQFWQWAREKVIVRIGDYPLKGEFLRANEEYTVVIANTILNLKQANHLAEALMSRRKALRN